MHETVIRVRFDEVDSMGVVHHPRYLVYFEVARTRYMRDVGVPYSVVMDAGTHLAVVSVEVSYRRPARYDDELVVQTWCVHASGVRLDLAYRVLRDGEPIATGTTRLASIEPGGRPKRMPPEIRKVFDEEAASVRQTLPPE